jgi:hypothetical protein
VTLWLGWQTVGDMWLEGVEHSGRIAAWTPRDELNNLLKFARRELSDDLGDTPPLMKQVNSRYYRLRHTLNGGPSH